MAHMEFCCTSTHVSDLIEPSNIRSPQPFSECRPAAVFPKEFGCGVSNFGKAKLPKSIELREAL